MLLCSMYNIHFKLYGARDLLVSCAVFFEVSVLVLLFMCGCVHRLLVVKSRLSYLLLSALCIEVLSAVVSKVYRAVAYTHYSLHVV